MMDASLWGNFEDQVAAIAADLTTKVADLGSQAEEERKRHDQEVVSPSDEIQEVSNQLKVEVQDIQGVRVNVNPPMDAFKTEFNRLNFQYAHPGNYQSQSLGHGPLPAHQSSDIRRYRAHLQEQARTKEEEFIDPAKFSFHMIWQGFLYMKTGRASAQMFYALGSTKIALDFQKYSSNGFLTPLRIVQRMRFEQSQLEGVARRMQNESEYCLMFAMPCGMDVDEVLRQSVALQNSFISYLQQKEAAGIINIAMPGSTELKADAKKMGLQMNEEKTKCSTMSEEKRKLEEVSYVIHIFPSCYFVNAHLSVHAPNLLQMISPMPHLIVIITTP